MALDRIGMNPKITRKKITDYQPDSQNANKGRMRGAGAIEDSFRRSGAGRSILVDKNGRVIAGNKSQQAAVDAGFEDAIEIETTGNTLIVVKRTDLDLERDEKARMLAYADNRTSELDLEWDAQQILDDLERGLPLDTLFRDYELEAIAAAAAAANIVETALNPGGTGDGIEGRINNTRLQIKPVLYSEDVADFEKAIRLTGIKERGAAVIAICRFYLESVNDSDTEGQ